MYDNFYFSTIKNVLDLAIANYCQTSGQSQASVDQDIVAHIAATSNQHRNPDPNISYTEPLCRLGYLYVHAGVNATLFEQTIRKSSQLAAMIHSHTDRNLSICAVGGGPGTELLSLAKYALTEGLTLDNVSFTVLDNVPQWGESWNHLSDAIRVGQSPSIIRNITRGFYPMDVTQPASYQSYAWLFQSIDLFVYNYLLSENQIRLADFGNALKEMVVRSRNGTFFVFVDRVEYASGCHFGSQNAEDLVQLCGLTMLNKMDFADCVTDRELAFGDYIKRFAPRRPRRWYRTPQNRNPTAFAVVAQKR